MYAQYTQKEHNGIVSKIKNKNETFDGSPSSVYITLASPLCICLFRRLKKKKKERRTRGKNTRSECNKILKTAKIETLGNDSLRKCCAPRITNETTQIQKTQPIVRNKKFTIFFCHPFLFRSEKIWSRLDRYCDIYSDDEKNDVPNGPCSTIVGI